MMRFQTLKLKFQIDTEKKQVNKINAESCLWKFLIKLRLWLKKETICHNSLTPGL